VVSRNRLLDAYLAPSEAAERIGISVQAVDRAARRGRLEHVWTPLGRIFPIEAVEEYAQEREARLRGER
jgi:predicted site-specific integrase-resolvase